MSDDPVLDSSGRFTLDRRAAAQQYANLFHRLEEGILYCIALLVRGGAHALTFEKRKHGWACLVEGAGPLPAEEHAFWTDWEGGMAYFAAQGFAALALRQGAQVHRYSGPDVESAMGEGLEWLCAGSTAAVDGEYLRRHLLYATYAVRGLPDIRWTRFLPQWNETQRVLVQHHLWERSSEGLGVVEFPKSQLTLPSARGRETRCVAHVLISADLTGPSQLRLVENGVTLQPVTWQEAPPGICAVLHVAAGRIKTDLSGRRVVDDEHLEHCKKIAARAALRPVALCALTWFPSVSGWAHVPKGLLLGVTTAGGLGFGIAGAAASPLALAALIVGGASAMALVREWRAPSPPVSQLHSHPIQERARTALAWIREQGGDALQ